MKLMLKSFVRALLFAAAALTLLSFVESRGMTEREASAAAPVQMAQDSGHAAAVQP